MKAKIKGIDVECTPEEFIKLTTLPQKKNGITIVIPAKRFRNPRHMNSSCKRWTKEEDAIVLNNIPRKSKRLLKGRSIQAIYTRKSDLLLHKHTSHVKSSLRSSERLKLAHLEAKRIRAETGKSHEKSWKEALKKIDGETRK